tara:strand:+ start:55 stop:318 length:264 start_codon:yes stop_codon:yes gene_type:complete
MPWNPNGTRKSSTYKMKYKNSAFPFKSPLKDHEKSSDGKVIEHVAKLSEKAKIQIEKDKLLANEPSHQLRRKKTIPMEGYIVPPTKK